LAMAINRAGGRRRGSVGRGGDGEGREEEDADDGEEKAIWHFSAPRGRRGPSGRLGRDE
jgi:hypothetical protein